MDLSELDWGRQVPLPEGVADLDEYRRKREREGTWPPTPEELLEYWREMGRRLRKRNGSNPAGRDLGI